tara:strand:- start:2242 stop:2388 length:147 start_codon:yes stop_codon:yes gene_type:complete
LITIASGGESFLKKNLIVIYDPKQNPETKQIALINTISSTGKGIIYYL